MVADSLVDLCFRSFAVFLIQGSERCQACEHHWLSSSSFAAVGCCEAMWLLLAAVAVVGSVIIARKFGMIHEKAFLTHVFRHDTRN